MTKYYLKIPSRNIVRHKRFSSINTLELAIGMAVCILLLLWVRGELYSAQLLEKNNLYRIVQGGFINQDEQYSNLKVPHGSASILEVKSRDFKESSRMYTFTGVKFIHKDTVFSNNRLFLAEPVLIKLFSFPFIKGDDARALHMLQSYVITREAAKRYFTDEYSNGKVVNEHNKLDFTITELVENNPRNSSLVLCRVAPLTLSGNGLLENWSRESLTHVILKNSILLSDSNHTMICIMNNGRFICAK